MRRFTCYITGLLLICTACNKQLDLKPEGTLIEADLLKNRQTAESFLADTYLRMMSACASNAYLLGDITGDVASTADQALIKGDIDPRDRNYDRLWSEPYTTINQANVVITKLALYADFDKNIQQQLIGEAKFIRAFCHLTLLQMYGDGALQGSMQQQGIPLMLASFDGYDGSQNKARSTNGEVYTQILQDLEEAIAVLPEKRANPVDQGGRATKGAAAALAARVCLYARNYPKAAAYASRVLNSNVYTLSPSFIALWPDHTVGGTKYPIGAEFIFAFPESFNATSNYGHNHGIVYALGYYKPLPGFLTTYEAKDERLLYTKNGTVVPKFTDPNIRDNVSMLRLAEVMLTLAEAQAQTAGVNPVSVELLNKVYSRAWTENPVPHVYTVADFTDKQQLIDRILLERKRELAFEGFARFDAIRYGRQPNPQLPPARFALPVPQHEIDITAGLIKQNPGYIK
ncbi:RagB/SusD family nutrient uptake outer membrane protein [Chitinophaga sp. Mgbs1]|uniref:RagB/SusD family nutrient uptake outer membrane protein n=1 Tax=Chitinophaga solisilvae TaxID=1233460 RepID=A0A433WQ25_9BACT|nr:RagB/SusD family nutrient uptake outer membrane protein [Chitinophaga solisilvae]